MADANRYHLDDLRSFAAALAIAVGVTPERSARLASRLLWFDAAGASDFGISSLPKLLKAIQDGEIDPKPEGKILHERPATAILDAERGVPLLILGKAAEVAAEKARDVGVGLVRARNLADPGSAAEIASGLAVGPIAVMIAGPGSSWSVALPSFDGLPVLFDSAFSNHEPDASPRRSSADASLSDLLATIAPWFSTLASNDGWIIAAVSIPALDPVSSFHERVEQAIALNAKVKGKRGLMPADQEARRIKANDRGVALKPASWKALTEWAGKLGVEPPGVAR